MSEPATGTLTVVIPAFNASETLTAAVSSALQIADQIVVVDDGSTDDTASVAASTRAKLVRQKNKGAAVARVAGAREATTDFVAFLDADDELIAEGTRRSIQLLADNPLASAAAGSVVAMQNDALSQNAILPGFEHVSAASLITNGYSPFPPAAIVYRLSSYRTQENLDISQLQTRYAEDYELLLRFALVGDILVHNEPVCLYRVHGGKSARNPFAVVEAKEQIRKHYADHLRISYSPLSIRQMKAAAHARKFHATRANRGIVRSFPHLAAAVINEPKLVARAVRRRL